MKFHAILVMVMALLLPGCALIDGVNDTLDYVNDAVAYVQRTANFADQLPALAQDAVRNPERVEALRQELAAMKEQITLFNDLEPPAIAKDIHQEILTYNETLQLEIDTYLDRINQGIIELEDSELLQTVQEITELLDRLQQLG